MSSRTQMVALVILAAVLAVVLYVNFRPASTSVATAASQDRFIPVNVDNPALRLDILQRFLNLEYKGVHRNIFSATLPPPPVVAVKPKAPAASAPPPTPPLSVEARYFGYVSDMSGNHRRAFFATNNNEDVVILTEGETLMGRFRVVRLTNTSADVEEVSSGRHAMLPLEQGGPTG